jgi:prepilin-type N-terminal cleavage/methylation domain-containing protein
MRRPATHPRAAGFTLIELVLVMLVIAVIAAIIVPSMLSFAAGRRTQDGVAMVLALSNFARTQAVSEGTVYRVNFDGNARTVWVTKQVDGEFVPATGDYGQHFTLPQGVRMSAQVTAASVAVPIQAPNVQQTTDAPAPQFGQPLSATLNTLVLVPHADGGAFVEIQPSGRTDPCLVHLSDTIGNNVDIGCATVTDVIHVLKPGEM